MKVGRIGLSHFSQPQPPDPVPGLLMDVQKLTMEREYAKGLKDGFRITLELLLGQPASGGRPILRRPARRRPPMGRSRPDEAQGRLMLSHHPDQGGTMYEQTYDEAHAPERENGVTMLDQALKRLHATVEELAHRLQPILMLRDPDPSREDAIKAMPGSGLRQRVDDLSSATDRIDRILRDLDL